MGTGSGTGVGTGKGVKGGWRVNAFLLLLTGWHAVLLPWSPLILRDTGFSATSEYIYFFFSLIMSLVM